MQHKYSYLNAQKPHESISGLHESGCKTLDSPCSITQRVSAESSSGHQGLRMSQKSPSSLDNTEDEGLVNGRTSGLNGRTLKTDHKIIRTSHNRTTVIHQKLTSSGQLFKPILKTVFEEIKPSSGQRTVFCCRYGGIHHRMI